MLGGQVDRPDRRWLLGADWSTLHLDDCTVLCFQAVTDHRPPLPARPGAPAAGAPGRRRAGPRRRRTRVLALGAVRLRDLGGRRVYADPAGHPSA
ncbi:VOC family protein [Kitasatospora sp. NPDC048194]|uniref:VOC family protein n=1 Tax=Kitasatospora sp. NPDC048194 TaxID=3364045 RepID=UPI00371D1D12